MMAHGAAADIGLAHRLHRDRRLHAGRDAEPLQRALHRQRVNHRRQHAHVVGRGALHADRRARQAAEDVAAADHQARSRRRARGPSSISSAMRATIVGIEAVVALAHQRLAGELQQDAAVFEIGLGMRLYIAARRASRPIVHQRGPHLVRRSRDQAPSPGVRTWTTARADRAQCLSCAATSAAKSVVGLVDALAQRVAARSRRP